LWLPTVFAAAAAPEDIPMRITPDERRVMNRRLRDRLPPAVLACLKRMPTIMMVVTTTLVITPEAFAKVQAGEAGIALVTTKTYSKDELKQTVPPNPQPDLDQRVYKELTGVLNIISNNLRDDKRHAVLDGLQTKQSGKDAYEMAQAMMRDPAKNSDFAMPGLRAFFGLETQRAVRGEVKDRWTTFTKISNMFKTNLNLGSMFGDKPVAPARGTIRYGLVVNDIVPDRDTPRFAAINDSMEDELQYAGHADVHWSIGPVDEKSKVFDGVGEPPAPAATTDDDDGYRIKVPQANFKTDVTTDGVDDDVSHYGNGGSAPMPNMKFTATQEDGYYQLSYTKAGTPAVKSGMEHTFKVPVAGTAQIGRRFDDHFHVVETAAYNILYDKRMPMLSVHHMHVEQRYSAELAKTFGNNHTLGVSGRTKATGVVQKPEDAPEQYSLNYSRNF
jgi:hypothetical protein